jgi:hypothetical protein
MRMRLMKKRCLMRRKEKINNKNKETKRSFNLSVCEN